MTRWYRAYVGTISDAKISEAVAMSGAKRSVVVAVWHSILESAAEDNLQGKFSTTARRVSATLQERIETVQRVFETLHETRMIENSVVLAWAKRQFTSDTSTTRVKKHRENKAKKTETARNGNETLRNGLYSDTEGRKETRLSSPEENLAGEVSAVGSSLVGVELTPREEKPTNPTKIVSLSRRLT